MARKIAVEIVGDSRSLEKAFSKSTKSAQKFQGEMTRTSGKMGGLIKSGIGLGVGFSAAQTGIDLATKAVKAGIGEWNESQKVTAQTASVLRSMGKTAGVTAKQVSSLSTTIMKKTGIDDEAIQSGENLLLTFRNIRNGVGKNNDIFNQATRVMTDFSVRFGKDIPSSAVLVGKALNDPIKGLTSLSRVGVQFTKGQKDQIKALVDAGKTAKAQKIILGELKRETGGAAEAAGKTLAGQINIAKQTMSNFAGELVGKMIPVLQKTISWLKDHWPEIKAAIQNFWVSVKPTLVAFAELARSVALLIRRHWKQIEPIVKAVGDIFRNQMKLIADVIQVFAAVLRGDWGDAWKAFKQIPIDAIKIVKATLTAAAKVFVTLAAALGKALAAAIKAPINAVIGQINRIKLPAFKIAIPLAPDIKVPSIDPIPHIGLLGAHTRPRLAAAGGMVVNGGMQVHLHGIQDVKGMEDALMKRHKQRAHPRRSTR